MYNNMHNPPHAGEVLKELYIEPLNLTVTELAKGLNVTRQSISVIVNGRGGISPEMAIKLGVAFNTTPEHWLNLQQEYDLWHAKKLNLLPIKKFVEKNYNLQV